MKRVFRRSILVLGVMLAIVAATLFIYRRPLLISYHRDAMINIWQTAHGLRVQKPWVVSVRKVFGFPSLPDSQYAIGHRDSLVRLGYLSTRNFIIRPVSLGTPEFTVLCEKVAAQTGGQPTAHFELDASGTRVVSLTIWATPGDFPRWEQFTAELAKR